LRLWVADEVDVAVQRYRTANNVSETWQTRERVVVALTGDKESETVLRRAAGIAKRSGAADLLAVHILRGDGLAGADAAALTSLTRYTLRSVSQALHARRRRPVIRSTRSTGSLPNTPTRCRVPWTSLAAATSISTHSPLESRNVTRDRSSTR
jgi:hypothetical protein